MSAFARFFWIWVFSSVILHAGEARFKVLAVQRADGVYYTISLMAPECVLLAEPNDGIYSYSVEMANGGKGGGAYRSLQQGGLGFILLSKVDSVMVDSVSSWQGRLPDFVKKEGEVLKIKISYILISDLKTVSQAADLKDIKREEFVVVDFEVNTSSVQVGDPFQEVNSTSQSKHGENQRAKVRK